MRIAHSGKALVLAVLLGLASSPAAADNFLRRSEQHRRQPAVRLTQWDIVSLAWFKGKLYVASWAPSGGATKGGGVFRANADAADPADIKWETITTNTFGHRQQQTLVGFAVLKDHLYAGTFINNFPQASGTEIFRTGTGDPDDWTVVAPFGWGDPQCNTDAHLNFVYDGYLYIGTEEAGCVDRKGADIWRTDGNLSPPYNEWQRVDAEGGGGFGHVWNNNVFGMDVFDGYFYASTWVWGPPGFEVWRAKLPPAGQPTTVPFDFELANVPGMGDPDNQWTTGLAHLGDTLFVSGVTFAGAGRGYLYRTTRGPTQTDQILNWHAVTGDGWPPQPSDPSSIGTDPFWLQSFKGKTYVAVYFGDGDRPGQLWAWKPSPAAEPGSPARFALP